MSILRALPSINALLGIALMVVLALAAREAIILFYGEGMVKDISEEKSSHAPLERRDYGAIVESGIFGKGRLETRAADSGASPGSLILIGTAEGAELAVFMDMNTGKQKAFRKGENVFGSGTLNAVGAKMAELASGGRTVSFKVPTSAAAPPVAQASSGGISKKGGEGLWEVDQRAISNVFDNMDRVLTDARFTPFVENGKLSGFRVSEIKPAGVFGLIGLQNGDVVMNINDFKLDSPGRVAQVLTGLKGESEVRVDIVRGKEPRTLKYRIR